MLFVFQTFLVILISFSNNVYSDLSIQGRRCDDLNYGGQWALSIGLKLRGNLLNLFGYLEIKKVSMMDPKVYTYFSNIKNGLKYNTIDVFPLIAHIPEIYEAKSSSDRILIAARELENANNAHGCEFRCHITRWERSLDLKLLLDSLPRDIILRGITVDNNTDFFFSKLKQVGGRFTYELQPTNHTELDLSNDFGQSILKIMREVELNKVCFNESFFGHLLYFYPWAKHNTEILFSVNKLARFFTSVDTDFFTCNIILKDLFYMLDRPWRVLDYILNQMEVTQCVPDLMTDIRKIRKIRESASNDVNMENLKDYGYLLNLINIVLPGAYPVEIILARNRLHDYLVKVLPFLNQDQLLLYLFDKPEEKLYAFLSFLKHRVPFPTSCVKTSISAIQSHLYFQIGTNAKTVSTELLNTIVDAWLAPDLLYTIRRWATKLKQLIEQKRKVFDDVFATSGPVKCTGLDSCFVKIVSLLQFHRVGRTFIETFWAAPMCLLQNAKFYFVKQDNKYLPPMNIKTIIRQIDYHRYTLRVVHAAETFLNMVQSDIRFIGRTNKITASTREELLLHILRISYNHPGLETGREVMSVLIDAIVDKITSRVPRIKSTDVSPVMPMMEQQITALSILSLLNSIRGMNFHVSEYEAAVLLVKEDEQMINSRLEDTTCRNERNVQDCLQKVLKVVEAKPANAVELENNYALTFLLRPTFCDNIHCFWLPNEERESGPLNPITVLLKKLLTKLNDAHENFNLKSDFLNIIKVIQTKDIKCVLDDFQFFDNVNQQEQIISFLRLLKNCAGLSSLEMENVDNIIDYLKFGSFPNTITIGDLNSIAHTLIYNTSDPRVAQIIKVDYQKLLMMYEAVQDILTSLTVDCSTFKKCIMSLIMATRYSRDIVLVTISNMLSPEECTPPTCPWLQLKPEESKIMKLIFSLILAIVNDSKTPLSVTFTLNRITSYLQSSEGQVFVNQIESSLTNTSNPVISLFDQMKNDVTMNTDIRYDVQVALNYLRFAAVPEHFQTDDLMQLLQSLLPKADEKTQSLINTAIYEVQNNWLKVDDIFKDQHVICVTLDKCLANILQVHDLPQSVINVITIFAKMLAQNISPEQTLNEMVTYTKNLINDQTVPFHIRLDLHQILTMLADKQLLRIITNVLVSLPSDIYLEFLQNIPFKILSQYGVVGNVDHIIRFLSNGSLPSNLNMNTFHDLANILINWTKDVAVKDAINHHLRVLDQLKDSAQKLSLLQVKCDTLQNCVDTILHYVHNMVNKDLAIQSIENIVNPVPCTVDTCPWIHGVGNQLLVDKVDKIRKELERSTVSSSSFPLIIRIYGKMILEYITPETIKMFPNSNDMITMLDSFARSDKFNVKVMDVSMSILKYLHRNLLPLILTHEDFIGLTEEMLFSTPSWSVKREITSASAVLQQYPQEIDSLLNVCEVKCANLQSCVADIEKCAREQPQNPASTIILNYLRPESCTRETCTWLVINGPTVEIPMDVLINKSLSEIQYLMYNENIPLHVQLLFRQLERVVKSSDFQNFVLTQKKTITLSDIYSAPLQKFYDTILYVLPSNKTGEPSMLGTLLQRLPVTVLLKYRLFTVLFNFVHYFEMNEMPHYLDVRTVQELANVLVNNVNAMEVTLAIISNSKLLDIIPDVEKWLNVLRVNCRNLDDCIRTLQNSLKTVMIPYELFQTLTNIISPQQCGKFNCPWLPQVDLKAAYVISLAVRELESMRQDAFLPLIIRFAADEVARHFTISNLESSVKAGKLSLKQLLQAATKSVHFPQHAINKAKILLTFLKNTRNLPTTMTYNDLMLLILEIIAQTPDLYLRQEISSYANIIYQHQSEFEIFLKKCKVKCATLPDCLKTLQRCKADAHLKSMLENLVNPPNCNPMSCPWRPSTNDTKTASVINPSYIIAVLPTKYGKVPVMLDLNDFTMVQILQRITTMAKQDPKNVFIVFSGPNEAPFHFVLNLWDTKVQQILLKASSVIEPYIDLNYMDVLTILYPFSDDRVRSFTLILSNPDIQNKLLRLTQQTPSSKATAITVVDSSGARTLAIDEEDQLFFQGLLELSTEGKRNTEQPSLILWPSHSGIWRALSIQKPENTVLAKLQNLPVMTIAGYRLNMVQTSIGFVQYKFDVYDVRVIHILDSIYDRGGTPVISLEKEGILEIAYPNEYGKLITAYIEMSEAKAAELEALSKGHKNVTEPTFTFVYNYRTLSIKMNPELAAVKDFLAKNTPANNEGEQYVVAKSILMWIVKGLNRLMKEGLPLNVHLELVNVLEKLSSEDAIRTILNTDRKTIFKLKIIVGSLKTVLNMTSVLPKQHILDFFQVLSPEDVDRLDIADSVKILTAFYTKGTIPETLNVNSLVQLIKLIQQTANKSVNVALAELIPEIQKIPNINVELSYMNVLCTTLQICIDNIKHGVLTLHETSSLRNILVTFLNIIKTGTSKPSVSPLDELLWILVVNLEASAQNKEVPFHIRLDLQHLTTVLKDKSNQARLKKEISNSSQSDKKIVLARAKDLLESIHAGTITNNEQIIQSVLTIIPYRVQKSLNINTNADNVKNYFQNGAIPSVLVLNTLTQLLSILANSSTNPEVTKKMLRNISLLQDNSHIDYVLLNLNVMCSTLNSCVSSLAHSLQHTTQDKVVTLLLNVLNPPNCTPETCSWTQLITGVGPSSPIIKLLEITLKKMCAIENLPDIPFHIKWDIHTICAVLTGESTQKTLIDILEKLPQSEIDDMNTISKNLMQEIESGNSPPLTTLIKVTLQNMPNTYISTLNIVDNIKNIIQFLETDDVPKSMDMSTYESFITHAIQYLKNKTIVSQIKRKLKTLKTYDDSEVDAALKKIIVNCKNFEVCLNTLLQSLQTTTQRGPIETLMLEMVSDILRAYQKAKNKKTVNDIAVLPIKDPKHHVILDLSKDRVKIVLTDMAFAVNSKYPTIVFNINDNNGVPNTIKLDGTDPRTILLLVILQEETKKTLKPTKIRTEDGPFIVGTVPNGKKMEYFIIRDDEQTYKEFKRFSTSGSRPFKLPFTKGTVSATAKNIIHHVGTNPVKHLTYLPPRCDLQPEYLQLPNGIVVHPQWKGLSDMKNITWGTKIPIVQPNCENKLITLNMLDQHLIAELERESEVTFVQPKDKSVVILSVTDANGKVRHIILDLSIPEVLNELKRMTADVNKSSVRRYIINYVAYDGTITPIIFDLNNLNVPKLLTLSEMTTEKLKPIQTENAKEHTKTVGFIVVTPDGKKHNILLNVSDGNVMDLVKLLSDPTEPYNSILEVYDSDGRLIRLYINKKEPTTVQKLIEISESSLVSPEPTVNNDKHDGKNYIVTSDLQNGKVTYKFNTNNEVVVKKLKELSSNSQGIAPSIQLLLKDGSIENIKLEIDSTPVRKLLDEVAQEVLIERPDGSLIIIKMADTKPIVLDISNDKVVEQLKLLSEGINPNGTDLFVLSFKDRFGNYIYIRLDLSDPHTIQILKELQAHNTDHRIKPIEIMTANRTSATVVLLTDENGNTIAVIIDGDDAIQKLLPYSDKLNENATHIKVDKSNNEVVDLYLDLNDKTVIKILTEASDTSKITIYPEIHLDTPKQQVTIPIFSNNKTYMLKCNLSDEHVARIIFDLTNVKGSAPLNYQTEVEDFSGNRRLIILDLSQPKVIKELKTICVTLPRPQDIILIAYKDESGHTVNILLNTRDPEVLNKLFELSNGTKPGDPNVKEVYVLDANDNVVTIYLDMKQPHILEALDHLHNVTIQYVPDAFTMQGTDERYNLLVLQVTDAHGKRQTVVLNLDDPKTLEFLQQNNNDSNPNSLKISAETLNGTVIMYLDVNNFIFIGHLISISHQRPADSVSIPGQYQQTAIVDLPFVVDGHTVIVKINLSNPEVAKVIQENASPPGPHTGQLSVTESNGHVTKYYVDLKDSDLAKKLMSSAQSYQYAIDEETLMIVPIAGKTIPSQFIVLDLTNKLVTDNLKELEKVGTNKVPFQYIDSRGDTKLIYLDLDHPIVQNKLLELQKYTPGWMKQMETVHPVGLYLVTSIVDLSGNVQTIVLDTRNQTTMDLVTKLQTDKPVRPLQLKYNTPNGHEVIILLDVSERAVLDRLKSLSVPTDSYPREIFTNRPTISVVIDQKLVIPIDYPGDKRVYYIYDTSKPEVFNNLISLVSDPDVKSRIIYMQEPTGRTAAIRINTSNPDIVRQLASYTTEQIVRTNPINLLTLTIPNDEYSTDIIILDVSNQEVLDGLKRLTENTPPRNKSTSLFTLTDQTGVYYSIVLDVRNPVVVGGLKELQQKTVTKILPVVVKTADKPRPFIVLMLVNRNKQALPIVLDLNNPRVIETLESLPRPNNTKNIFSFDIANDTNEPHTIFINTEDPDIQTTLLDLTKLTPIMPNGIITVDPDEIIVVPLVTDKYESFTVILDPKDSETLNTLTRLSEMMPPGSSLLILNVNENGLTKAIQLDKLDPTVIQTLKDLGKNLQLATVFPIIPAVGDIPLMSFQLIKSNGTIDIITLDLNNNKVTELLKQIYFADSSHSNTRRLIIPQRGKNIEINVDSENPQVTNTLDTVSKLVSVTVVPMRVIAPEKKLPLVAFVTSDNSRSTVVTLDLEDDNILDNIADYSIEKGPNTVTLLFNTPFAGKKSITLDIKDAKVTQKLKSISAVLPIRIIPVEYGRPIVSITLDNRIVNIDVSNPEVVRDLIKLSKTMDDVNSPKYIIEAETDDGFTSYIKIGMDNPLIRQPLLEIGKKTKLPEVKVIINKGGFKEIDEVRILPPRKLLPLILLTIKKDFIALDLNNYKVMTKVMTLGKKQKPKNTEIHVSSMEGNVEKLYMDLKDTKVIRDLKQLSKLSPIKLTASKQRIPIISVMVPNRNNSKRFVPLDFNNPTVWEAFVKIDKRSVYNSPFLIQLPTDTGFKVFAIDFTNPEVITVINKLGDKGKIKVFQIDVKDTFGITWRIYLDVNNPRVVQSLQERSDKTPPETATILKIKIKHGKELRYYLNLNDMSTINLLKRLTMISTGSVAEQLTAAEKKLWVFIITTPNDKNYTIKLDVNNDSVMRKVVELSKMFNGNSKHTAYVTLTNGTTIWLELDPSNENTIINLLNLQSESLGEKGVPLIPLRKEESFVQQRLIRFEIDSLHYGRLNITIDLYKPEMMDVLEKLSRAIAPNVDQTTVEIDDGRGRKVTLRMDLKNQKTVEYLAYLTEISIGTNPITAPPKVIHLADYQTFELPYSVERAFVTIDRKDLATMKRLVQLNQTRSETTTAINLGNNERPQLLYLDLFDRRNLEKLWTISIPTVLPQIAPQIPFITLVFFQAGYRTTLPSVIDLSNRNSVLHIINLSQKFRRGMQTPSPVELRDDTGQYFKVPLDLNDANVANDLKDRYPARNVIEIPAQNMPYLQLIFPGSNGPYNVISFQLKPKNIHRLKEILRERRGDVTLHITDALYESHTFTMALGQVEMVKILQQVEGAVLTEPPLGRHNFVVYDHDEEGKHTPIYLDMHDERTLNILKGITYFANLPLTVIQFTDTYGQLNYHFIDIINPETRRILTTVTGSIQNHVIQVISKLNIVRVHLHLPSGDVNVNLDVSNPRVLEELHNISFLSRESMTTAVVELEDNRGFPIILKLDYSNPEVMQRFQALNTPNQRQE